jgi:ABC-type branched-subunit amino acid transport system ATPase component
MFDEPTAGMSHDEAPVILNLIRALKQDKTKTILLVEHKMDVVRELADRIIVLHNGSLVADGEPAEVIASKVVQEAYLGVQDEQRNRHPGCPTMSRSPERAPFAVSADPTRCWSCAACTRTSVPTTSCTAWTCGAAGQVTLLLGRNGAGKTTTLRTIMGLWQASRGSLHFAARDITRLHTPQIAGMNIAYVPETMGIFADLTVEENMLLAARAAPRADRMDAARLRGSSACSRRSRSSGTTRPASCPAARSRCWRWRAPSSSRASC